MAKRFVQQLPLFPEGLSAAQHPLLICLEVLGCTYDGNTGTMGWTLSQDPFPLDTNTRPSDKLSLTLSLQGRMVGN